MKYFGNYVQCEKKYLNNVIIVENSTSHMSLLRFGGQLVEFERLERFAEMFVLPLGASFALDVTAPAEGAVARCRDQNPSGVVAAAAAQQVAAVDALGCFIARPAGCSDGTCFTPKIK